MKELFDFDTEIKRGGKPNPAHTKAKRAEESV